MKIKSSIRSNDTGFLIYLFICLFENHFFCFAFSLHDKSHMHLQEYVKSFMMMSSNCNIFRVTGPLWGGGPLVTGGFPSQRPVPGSLDVFFELYLNKRLSKRSGRRWFETLSCSLWRHCNVLARQDLCYVISRNHIGIYKLVKQTTLLFIEIY